METNQKLPQNYTQRVEITIPEFGSSPAMILDFSKIYEGERRLVESRAVNPATYNDLEFVFNEGYREAKRYMSLVGYELTRARKALRDAKARAILDEYPVFLKENGLKDNSMVRDAFLERQPDHVAAQDRIDSLVALETLLDGKVKNFEIVCRYMRKQMDLIIRSGVDTNKYVR